MPRPSKQPSRLDTLRMAALLALVPFAACECDVEPLEAATGAISGKVCNPLTGAPAPGATISLRYESERLGPQEREIETDAAGGFMLAGVPEGKHTVLVTAAQFTTSFEVDVAPNQTAAVVDEGCRELALPGGKGEIAGQICNRHVGTFVQDATVRVLLPNGDELSVQSDQNGNFILEDVPAGVHIVYVSAPGYSRSHQVEVKGGEQTLLEEQQRVCEAPDPSQTGSIRGTLCTDDEAGLAGVRVFLTSAIDGYTFEDYTDANGNFLIAGIPAPATVQVRAERAGFMKLWNDVEVFATDTVPDGTRLDQDSSCSALVPDTGVRYLVVNGTYDKIQNVLDRMGLTNVTLVEGNPLNAFEPWAANVFGDYSALSQYDAVFINCGVSEIEFQGTPDPVVAANLRKYVQEGGSLYVSDQAYDLVELVWPERIDFLFDDALNSAAEAGVDGTYAMSVAEPGLRDFLGKDEISVELAYGYFAVIREVAPGTTVYLRTDMRYHVNNGVQTLLNTPITVAFSDGAPGVGGRVVFTSFHQENDESGEDIDDDKDAVLRYLIFEL
jgi:hypothetical protein